MTDTLLIGENFNLPVDVATHRVGILAMPGAGKSNASVVLAEGLYDAGIPWVAIDPKGDWWGVRVNDSAHVGLDIPILGGLHGDIPLEATSGKLVAEMVVSQRMTCVLDVSEFETRQDMFKFLADFGRWLYRLNEEPMHIFADECDDYLPQKPGEGGNLPDCLGVWSRLVRRGRFKGLGVSLISQRSAFVNKDVLNMVDAMFALRAFAPGDRRVIADWFESVGGDKRTAYDLLPSLEDGEALIYSPAWLKTKEPLRVKFLRRRTYDSGQTPEVGKGRPAVSLADVDLLGLRDRMSEAVAHAEANDPAKLKAKVRELERELQVIKNSSVATVDLSETVRAAFVRENESLVQQTMELGRENAALRARDDELTDALSAVTALQQGAELILGAVEGIRAKLPKLTALPAAPAPMKSVSYSVETAEVLRQRTRVAIVPDATYPPMLEAEDVSHETSGKLPKVEAAILAALVNAGHALDTSRIAIRTLYSPGGGGFQNGLSALRTKGFIDGKGSVSITMAGARASAGNVARLPELGPVLCERWAAKMPKAEAAILRVLSADGRPSTKEQIADMTGYQATGGGFQNALSHLRTAELITRGTSVELVEELR